MNSTIIIDGDESNNALFGGAAPELMNGNGGDDFLYGADGNDTLDGGAGNDILNGADGANTFRWGRGGGRDIIERTESSYELNLLQLGEDVAPSELQLFREDVNLVLAIAGSEDRLTVHGFFMHDEWNAGDMLWGAPLSEIRFADGTRWDMLAIQTQLKLTSERLVVLGDQDDRMSGRALDGAGGNDALFTGGPGLLMGGSGNDTLHGSMQADVLHGGSGDDILLAGEGDDFLDGGAGNDLLDGQGGFDTYRFGYGSGHDTIAPSTSGRGDLLTIDMGPAVQAGTLMVLPRSPDNADLVLELPLSGERLTLKEYFSVGSRATIHFADGSTLRKADIDKLSYGIMPVNTVTGTDAGDQLHGTDNADILRGGGGDDYLTGNGGDDLLLGGDGNDALYGFSGNDVIDGGAGDDRITTGDGASMVLFGRNSGHDELVLAHGEASMTVLLEAGIGLADIRFAVDDHDLLVSVGDGQADLRMAAYFVRSPGVTPRAFALQFADGTLWDREIIRHRMLTGNADGNIFHGTPDDDRIDGRGGDDALYGQQGNDLLLGGAGNDVLSGDEGDDTLNGGQNADFLDGGSGNDTYVFARGDGLDWIMNTYKSTEIRYATIAFADGISPDQVHLKRVAGGISDDLAITIDDQPYQQIRMAGFEYDDPAHATNMQLKEIRFADGSKWDMAAILRQLTTGTAAGETIVGTEADDVIDARGGDDVLDGQGGNDTLTGGGGNDQLAGGAGTDTYAFNLGDGQDRLTDANDLGVAGSVVRFGAGITPQSVDVRDIGGDQLRLTYGNLGDAITLVSSGVLRAPALAVEQIVFADGSTRKLTDFMNHAPVLKHPLPDMAAARGQLFKQSLWSTFSDPDAQDTLSLTVRQANGQPLPEWLVYDARETTLVGYAPMSPSAVYQLRVTATDKGGLQASDDFTLTLDAPNMAPYVKSSGFGAKTDENTFVSMLLPTFADVDAGDALSVKVNMADGSALPGWMSDAGGRYVSARPGFGHAGTYVITATATDKGGLSVSSNIELVVANVNRAPVPTQAPAPVEAAQGTPFSFVLPARTFVDPDGDLVVNKMGMADGSPWPAWLLFDTVSQTLSGTPPAGSAPVLTLIVNATDTSGLASDIIFKLNVAADAPLNLGGKGEADVLDGLSAGDTLLGLAGNDQLNGFGGNDTLDGGAGNDRMAGGAGNDLYLLDANGDVVVELPGEGRDTVLAKASYTLAPNIEALTLGGTLGLAGYGNNSDNVLNGNSANNFLAGNGGNDILQGGAGNDSLVDNSGKNLFDGGAGNDSLAGGAGNELFIGAAGNDIINPGSGIDIIAFNRGDGSDTLNPSRGLDNVISLGRGIAYADLSLQKVGEDLILGTGAGEQINLKSWYASAGNHSVATLQMFIEGGGDYHPALGATINSQKMQQFNFDALASKFDQALLADPALTAWKLASGLGLAMTGASETTAAGSDLAQQYATLGTLANLAQVPALTILGSSSFGDVNQALAGAPVALADGSAFLM